VSPKSVGAKRTAIVAGYTGFNMKQRQLKDLHVIDAVGQLEGSRVISKRFLIWQVLLPTITGKRALILQ
jgi:hypothetical protein